MIHTISALVKNRPGVLAEMAGRFGSSQVNIRSISCGETENPEVSRMVISVEADDDAVTAITSDMESLDVVIQVDDLGRKEFVDRELVLAKLTMDRETTTQLMQIFEVFRAHVVGMGQETITVELSGDQERVDGFIQMVAPFGIRSLCRSGRIALKRGDD
ncbi:acetolactate synthase small subunit [Salidesulfovibrio brasiliensis]|uniref:acetolactate synthase small subunit n=1 Tax=Salidesulfovibrio brasiliensis TaxID=221711 RepID=UPI0006D0B3DD|nr:acetolactate synthase small subunit [Salidesulfovibrio brasiliensis]